MCSDGEKGAGRSGCRPGTESAAARNALDERARIQDSVALPGLHPAPPRARRPRMSPRWVSRSRLVCASIILATCAAPKGDAQPERAKSTAETAVAANSAPVVKASEKQEPGHTTLAFPPI